MAVAAARGKLRWWYESIADLMLAKPHLTQQEIAAELGKHPNTIGQIIKSDAFQAYFSQRRAAFRAIHDASIVSKTTEIAELGLDLMLEQMKTKRDAIPLARVVAVTESALDRLGFTPKSMQQNVNVNVNNGQQNVTQITVTKEALDEARAAHRAVEQMKLREVAAGGAQPPRLAQPISSLREEEPSVDKILEGEILDAAPGNTEPLS